MGKREFQSQYGKPALVGLGLIAQVDTTSGYRETGTLTMAAPGPEVLPATVVGRAWLITKGPEGPAGPAITAGRSAYNDIVIPEYTVSHRHCQFRYEPGRILLSDLGSFNGTFHNGQRVNTTDRVKLRPHDQIAMGRYLFGYISAEEFMSSVEGLAA